MKQYAVLAAALDRHADEQMRTLVDAGDLIGHRLDGSPIHLAGGASADDFSDWIPTEIEGPVVQRVLAMSAVEALARPEPMATDSKEVPRSAGIDVEVVAKSNPYGEDTSTNDTVALSAKKFGKAIRIADEDLQDTSRVADVIGVKQVDWATSYAKMIDNATLATSGAANGTTIPFTSLYKSLRTTNSATGYTADDNYKSSSTVTYANLSDTMGLYEAGDYFEEGASVVIAHSKFRSLLRGIVDDQHRPIFIEGTAGTPDTLFGVPIKWTNGAKTHPGGTATPNPTGKPLLFIGNKNYLILGKRSGPEYRVAGADTGVGFLTDEALMKMRARRGFAVGHEAAWAVLEYTGS